MQQSVKSKWLHKSFVFLLSILVATSFMIPGSFGTFGAQEAKAADEPVLLDSSWIEVNSQGVLTAFNDTVENYPKKIIIPRAVKVGEETRIIKEIAANSRFSGKGFTHIEFEDGSQIEKIGANAFQNNSLNMTEFKLPKGIKTVGDGAFQFSGTIQKVNLADCDFLEKIPASMFNRTYIRTLILPKYTTSIGGAAFYASYIGGTLDIPRTVTSIGDGAFCGNTGLTIDMSKFKPDEIKGSSWSGAEWGGAVAWSNARSINNPQNPDVIAKPELASTNTPFLFDTEQQIIYGLKSDLASKDYTGWTKPVTDKNGVTTGGKLIIPAEIGGMQVKGFACGAIGAATRTSKNAIREIEFENTDKHIVDELPDMWGYHCPNLQKITNIPATVKKTGRFCFYYTENLEELTLLGVTNVSNNLIPANGKIKRVTLKSSEPITIGSNAFYNADGRFTEIVFTEKEKDTVTGFPWGAQNAKAFWKTGTPTVSKVNNTDDHNGWWMFDTGTKAIVGYRGPMGDSENLVDLNIPNKVTVGGEEFDVKALGRAGRSLVSFRDDYVEGKSGFRNVTIPEGVESISSSFNSVKIYGDVTFPRSSLKTIINFAFSASGIKSLDNLPDSLTTIGNYAFSGNSTLTGQIRIPGNVTAMGNNAFQNCPNITSFDMRMYRDKASDPGAYSETPPAYKKAPAAVSTRAPFMAHNAAGKIYWRDTSQPQPKAVVTTDKNNNTATITFQGYTTDSFTMVKDFTAVTSNPAMPDLVNKKIQATTEDPLVSPSTVQMVIASSTKTINGKKVQGGNAIGDVKYKVDMTYGNKNSSEEKNYPYSTNLNVFRTLTYDINAGDKTHSGAAPTAGDVFVKEYPVTLAGQGAMKVPGYKFSGWTLNKNGSGDLLKAGTTWEMKDKDTTLYAKWDVNNVKTTFNANGGTFGGSPTKDVTAQEGKLLSEVIGTNPTRTGYRLAGWASKNNATKPDETEVGASTKTVYAVWDANDVRVTYNGNGGEVSGEPSVVRDGKVGATIPNIPTASNTKRTGYDFDGWYNQKTGGTKITATTFPNANAEYYAHWNPKNNTVKFAANPEGTTSQRDVTVKSGQPVGVTPTAQPKDATQYRFENNWVCDADGRIYKSDQIKNYVVDGSKSTVTFTAQFTEINKVTVTYDYNGGVDADGRHYKNFTGEPGTGFIKDSEVPTPKLTGHTLGWDRPKPDVYPGQSLTINALWTPNDNAVSFVVPNGTADPEGKTVKSGESVGVSPKAEVDLGYKFDGLWVNSVDNKNYSADQIADYKVSGEHPEITFTAQVSERPDWFALDKSIKDAEAKIAGTEKDKYTDASVKALEQALEAAKKVLNDPEASDAQLKAEKAAVDAAAAGLKTKEQQQADDALAKAKSDAKAELDAVNVNLYEEPEKSTVIKAIDDGKKEIDASITIPQVDAAKKKALDIIAAQKTAAQKVEEQKQAEDPKNIPTEVTDKTPANLVAVTTAITTAKNDGDLKGSTYAPLKFQSKKQTKKNIKLQWSKVKGAKQYTVYANQCGVKNKYKKLATVKGKTLNVKKVAGKKLKKGVSYKFLIIAENGDKVSAISKTLHIRTAGHKKYTNYKSVSVKKTVIKKAKKLKKGKTLKLNAKGVVPKGKKVSVHVKTRYESANKKVATVTKAGKVKGIKKGKAKIYCYVQNGLAKVVTVTVK